MVPGESFLPSPIRGGRREAERLLRWIDRATCGASRNHLDGAMTLAEVRDAVFHRRRQDGLEGAAARRQGGKLISEQNWRDCWQRLWHRWGDGIWDDREPLRTGLACIDAFAADLLHWRRVRWQAGAGWFLQQRVVSSFAASYEALQAQLFVFDRALIAGGTATTTGGQAKDPNPLGVKRLGFPFEGLLELPVTIRQGDVAEQVLEPKPFLHLPDDPARPLDRRRFGRYWTHAEPAVWRLLPQGHPSGN